MIERFIDDDDGYRGWIYTNLAGYVVNAERSPSPSYLILHKATCETITPTPDRVWTRDYIKICSTRRFELEEWARHDVGGCLQPCGDCSP